jgi:sensor histidine kinase YesM
MRIERNNWHRSLPLYFALGLLLSLVKTLSPFLFNSIFVESFNETFGWLSSKWYFLITDFLAAMVFYCFVLAFGQALNYYRQYRERELRASQLEWQLARAELQALKMQLQPHFLFNTLHSISALQFEDVGAAQKMTARLGDFLRLTLDDNAAQVVSLKREVEFLKCYLDIERVRFGKRLETEFDIEPETLEAQVPNLILQPLVENAIKHGVSAQAKAGLIRVSARLENGSLRIEVADNGRGLPDNYSSANGFSKKGLGLANVRERLKQLYGPNHDFELQRAPEGGLLVSVSVPLTMADPARHGLN